MNFRKPEYPFECWAWIYLFEPTADFANNWLPRWVVWVGFTPFVMIVSVSLISEWVLRFLLTPARFWDAP